MLAYIIAIVLNSSPVASAAFNATVYLQTAQATIRPAAKRNPFDQKPMPDFEPRLVWWNSK